MSSVTGETRVRRFLGSYDCGRILNPKTAASQFRGGIIMGLGLALMGLSVASYEPWAGLLAGHFI